MTQPVPPRREVPTAEQWDVRHTKRMLAANAAGLRKLADDFDRVADQLDGVPAPGRRTYVSVVVEVIHRHATWLANASLGVIVEYAAGADRAREAGE